MTTTVQKTVQPMAPPIRNQERVEQILYELEASQRRSNQSTLVLGVLSFLVIGTYFYFVYGRINEHLQPVAIVDLAQAALEDRWPETRDAIESRIKDSAPDWASQLSAQALAAIPQARTYLTDYALQKSDELAEDAIHLSEDQFREYVRKYRSEFQEAFRDLAKSPSAAEGRLKELRDHFEAEMDVDFDSQVATLLQTVEKMNEKMVTLKSNQDLTAEQKLERKVLMLARRLQADQLSSP